MKIRFTCFIVHVFLCAFVANTETQLGGIIDTDLRLTEEDSPYLVTQDILVTDNARLTIYPGVVIRIGKLIYYDDSIPQHDLLDSQSVAIKIEGILSCVGRPDKRIRIASYIEKPRQCSWYGLVLSGAYGEFNEIAFTDISGACSGITISGQSPVVRNSVLEFNNAGILCEGGGKPLIVNNILINNYHTGIRYTNCNPEIYNNIIVFNDNHGIWCDRNSQADIKFNCMYGNGDGNLLECLPEIGTPVKTNKRKDSVDVHFNLFTNPVFMGSPADSLSKMRDLSTDTRLDQVKDTSLARAIQENAPGQAQSTPSLNKRERFTLSKYSPCINAGHKARRFRDSDGSRNDIGIYGGPEFLEKD